MAGQSSRGDAQGRSTIVLVAVTAAATAGGGLVFARLVAPDPPPRWDEAAHILQGALIAYDLGRFDPLGLVFDLYRQVYWPPLFSWLAGVAFLVAGPTLEVGRGVSVAAYVLLAPTLFLVARAVAPRRGLVAGTVAAVLALASPGLAWYASKAMLELPGLLAIAVTLLVYCRLARRPDAPPRAHALLGVAAVITYLVKTNYGILILLSIALARLIEARFEARRLLDRRNLAVLLPLVAFALVWFAYPPKIASTWSALVNRPWGGEEARGLQGLLFYPRAIVEFSGSWWMAALVILAGSAAAWRLRRRPGVALLAVLALLQFGIGEIHHTKVERHILPLFPPLFVLAGIAAADLWSRLGRPRARLGALAVLAGIAALHVRSLERYDWEGPPYPSGAEILEHVSALALESAPALVLTGRDSWPQPPVVDWHLVSRGSMAVTAAGSVMDPRRERRIAERVDRAPVPPALRSGVARVLERYDAPTPLRSLHVGDRDPDEQRDRFDAVFRETVGAHRPEAIIAVVGTADTTRFTLEFFAPSLDRAGYRKAAVREFPLAFTRVFLYRRP